MTNLDREIANEPTQQELKERTRTYVTGIIAKLFWDRGYGFIVGDNRTRGFFHMAALIGGLVFDDLDAGQAVELEVTASEKGPRAALVRPITAAPLEEPGAQPSRVLRGLVLRGAEVRANFLDIQEKPFGHLASKYPY